MTRALGCDHSNNEFFLLSNGCCLGLFRNDNKCGGLQNAFTTFISGLFPSLKEIAG